MKTFFIAITAALLCFPVTILHAATVVQYNSGVVPATGAGPAADPSAQGWILNTAGVTNAYAAGFNSGNGGWRTVDGTNSAPAYYQSSISTKAAANMAYGWTYTAVLSLDSDAYSSTGGFVDNYYLPPNNGRQKDIHLWIETVASKTYIVQLTIDADKNLWGNDGTTNHQLTTDGSAYDNFKTLTITFDGASAVLTCEGNHYALTDRATHGQNRVVFGAVSTPDQGSAIWNHVKLDAPVVFYDDFAAGTKQSMLDNGWTEVAAGNGWGCDDPHILWGNGMTLRYITESVIEAGSVVTIDLTFNRPWAGYVYSGDLIAWNGSVATVLGSFSMDGTTDPATHTFAPISGTYAGQLLGIHYSHSANWGETSSIKLTGITPVGEPIAQTPDPANGVIDVPINKVLSWSAPLGVVVASFDVFVDPNEAFLTDADADYYSPGQTATSYTPSPELAYGTTYYWRVDVREPNTTVHTGDVWSFTTLSPDPKITGQPENQLVFPGEQAEFAITAVNPFTSDDTGMSYQWYKVGEPDTAVGTDSPVLTIAEVAIEDSGHYYCVVTVVSPPEGIPSNPVQSTAAKLLVKRLLGNWQFEDNLDDSSGNGYNGTPVGTPAFGAIPAEDPSRQVSGKALHCTVGGADYVEVSGAVFDDVDTQVTISLWTYGINQPNEGNQSTFIIKDASDVTLAYMQIPHSTARIPTWIGNAAEGLDGWYEGTSAPTSWFNGRWNHWVLTKDSEAGILRVYRNGILFLESTSAFKPFYGAAKFYIGGNNDSAGAFGGYIDDVRVYNYALSAEEIAAIHPRPMLPGPTDGQANRMYNTPLSWTPGDGTISFTVYCSDVLDPDPNIPLSDPIVVSGLTEPTAILPENLKLQTTYYWYVEEYNDSAQLVWTSDLWSFGVRELVADIDDNSAVVLEDVTAMAARWTDDVRGTPEDYMIDSCVYDPNNKDRNDPASYANYWDTYWTYTGGVPGGTTGGNALYGYGYCEAVKDPNQAVAWHYDVTTSTGGTDTDFIYWHRTRPRLALNLYDELRMEVMAAPGSVLKDPWWVAFDWAASGGDAVEYVIPVSILGDNKWHDLVIPLKSLDGIEDMDNMRYIHAGIWGSGIKGTWYIRNMRAINNAGTVMCLPMYYIPEDLNYDCFVNLEDAAIMAREWLMDARNP